MKCFDEIILELKNIKADKKRFREFGLIIGGIFILIAVYLQFKGYNFIWLIIIGAAMMLLGLAYYRLLKLFYYIWMGFAVIIGFFISRLILSFLYISLITPTGLLVKIFKGNILDGNNKNANSYWIKKESGEDVKLRMERMF